jgi:hypothetical protein
MVNFVSEILDSLVGGEVATKNGYVPAPNPNESAAASMTPDQDVLLVSRLEGSSTKTVRNPKIWVPVPILFADKERVSTEFSGKLI